MNKLLLGVVISIGITSCSLFTEPDLNKEEVFLLAPADGIKTAYQQHTFWWEHVPDAESYNLLIVSPSFDSVFRLIADTNLTGNNYVGTLAPGEYEWGVSALNSVSSTPYSVFSITIDTTGDLVYLPVILIQPEVNFNTNNQEILFRWDLVPGATRYSFGIRDSSWLTGQDVITPINTEYDTVTIILNEGRYEWGVQAYDETSNSSTTWYYRPLIIDTTSPDKPVITIPVLSGDTISAEPYSIEWRHPSGSLSSISDSIVVASDSAFHSTDIIESLFISDTELSVSSYPDGKYYVKVKSVDAAGNQSEYSNISKFFIYKEE